MLDNQDVFAAAEAAILVVDEDRKASSADTGATRGARGRYYTLEGAVADVIARNLDQSFNRVLEDEIARARREEINMRLGVLDPRDLPDYDPENPEIEPLSAIDKLERRLTHALKELKGLREHSCTYDHQDYCTICGLDGRA